MADEMKDVRCGGCNRVLCQRRGNTIIAYGFELAVGRGALFVVESDNADERVLLLGMLGCGQGDTAKSGTGE